jgi:hypothetical protein
MLIHRILDNAPFGPTDVEAIAQAFEAICLTLNITRADERDLVARKVINCATLGTLNRQDICKTVLAEFQDQAASKTSPSGSS